MPSSTLTPQFSVPGNALIQQLLNVLIMVSFTAVLSRVSTDPAGDAVRALCGLVGARGAAV